MGGAKLWLREIGDPTVWTVGCPHIGPFIPTSGQGFGGFLAAPLFGKSSDAAAAAHPDEPVSRLIYSSVAVLVAHPLALLLYGWSLQVSQICYHLLLSALSLNL